MCVCVCVICTTSTGRTAGFSEKAKSAESAGIFAIFGKSLGGFGSFLTLICPISVPCFRSGWGPFPGRHLVQRAAQNCAFICLLLQCTRHMCNIDWAHTGGFSEKAKSAESAESAGIFAIFWKIIRGVAALF